RNTKPHPPARHNLFKSRVRRQLHRASSQPPKMGHANAKLNRPHQRKHNPKHKNHITPPRIQMQPVGNRSIRHGHPTLVPRQHQRQNLQPDQQRKDSQPNHAARSSTQPRKSPQRRPCQPRQHSSFPQGGNKRGSSNRGNRTKRRQPIVHRRPLLPRALPLTVAR